MSKYDAETVEEIKAQFQRQIETMLQSQERNSRNSTMAVATPKSPAARLSTSHLQSEREKELDDIRDLQRGKSFLEARTAVQKQIERMFSEAAVGGGVPPTGGAPGRLRVLSTPRPRRTPGRLPLPLRMESCEVTPRSNPWRRSISLSSFDENVASAGERVRSDKRL